MQFTKTLIAAALLAVAAGAQAQVSSSDLVLDVVDTSNNSTYVLDLGITAATLVSDLASNQGISATVSAATDANFSAFISAVGSDSLVYQVMGSNGYASYVATDASTTLPSDSGTAGHVSTLNSASSFIGIDIATMSSDASGTITSSLYENTIAGIFGGKINNDSVYTTDSAVGTAMNVIYMYNPSGNAISINEIAPGVMPMAFSARKPPTPSSSSWRMRVRASPP